MSSRREDEHILPPVAFVAALTEWLEHGPGAAFVGMDVLKTHAFIQANSGIARIDAQRDPAVTILLGLCDQLRQEACTDSPVAKPWQRRKAQFRDIVSDVPIASVVPREKPEPCRSGWASISLRDEGPIAWSTPVDQVVCQGSRGKTLSGGLTLSGF